MPPQIYNDLKRTNTIVVTVPDGAGSSNWVRLPSSVLKVLGLKTPSNTPNTTLVFHIRSLDNEGVSIPVASDTDIASVLTLNVNGLGAFGARALTPLGSWVDGFHEIRFTLGSTPTGDADFILSVPSMTTE